MVKRQRRLTTPGGKLITGFITVALSTIAHGQDETTVKQGVPKAKKSERIEVTGSRIKRTEIEGVSPVLILDQDTIRKSGSPTVSDLLNKLSISAQGSYSAPVVSDTRGTVTSVNIRGLGSSNTLVLLDGRRLPDEAGKGTVDLSTIPMAAVERIEILKESASAIYGSDATGGVVNIITKKDLNGSIVYASGMTPKLEGNASTEFAYLTGVSNRNFRNMTILNYRHQEPIYYRDRDWTKGGLSFFSYPANYVFEAEGYKITPHPNCEAPANQRIDTGDGGPEPVCSYNFSNTMAFSPEITQLGVLNNFEYNINDEITLFSTIRATKNTHVWNMAPNAGSFTIPQDVAQANLTRLGLVDAEIPADVELYYRGLPWGLRQWEEEKTVLGATAGLKGSLSPTWDWSLSVGHTESKKDTVNAQGFMLVDELVSAIEAGEFNPFETTLGADSLAVVDRARYEPFTIIETDANTYNFDVTGELFEIAGGPVGLAAGLARSELGYKKQIDTQSERGNVFGVTEDKGADGSREVNAAYMEVSVPLLENLEFQLAARYDQYSDFGSTTNPKFGFRYLPTNRVMIRGGAGTGFKAPTLDEIYKGTTLGLLNLTDTPTCESTNIDECPLTTEVEIETTGNQDLDEETSVGYTLGLVTEPLDGFSIGVDYWYVRIKDIVKEMEPQDILDHVADGRSFDGVTITRQGGAPDGRLERIVVPTMNLGESEDSGVDLTVDYRVRTGTHRWDLHSEYSRKFYARSVPFPGEPKEDTLGDRGEPRWRDVTSVSDTIAKAHTFTLRQNVIGKQESENSADTEIGSFTTIDAQYAWSHPWDGILTFGALNVLDRSFPEDPTERNGDDNRRVAELFGPDGITYYVKAEQVF